LGVWVLVVCFLVLAQPPNPQTPNPQSPIPNPQRERKKQFKIKNVLIKKLSKINNKHLK